MEKNRSLNMDAEEFRQAGYDLIDSIAAFMKDLPQKKVTNGESPASIRSLLKDESLPSEGQDVGNILNESTDLLFGHSLFNGHLRFWGYITSSASPIGALADLLASSVNANVGAFALSPVATEIERQTVKWLAELIGYDTTCGGIFVSGGNMANFLGFLAARRYKFGDDVRKEGLPELYRQEALYQSKTDGIVPLAKGQRKKFTVYCAKGTHTWIQKAVDMFGHGTESIRWIGLTETQQMDKAQLQHQIDADIQVGHVPFLVVGNAGSVSSGVVDPLSDIAGICKAKDLWFHVDGAYGAPAAALPELTELFKGITEADSIALDPHKWLYSPLEAGCILVRNEKYLHDAFNFNPEYYNFGGDGKDSPVNFHEYGMQNSRGFRALKVWMSLKQVGKTGISDMIRKDIGLAETLFEMVSETKEIQPISQSLSITTFRYVPVDLPEENRADYLNELNKKLLNRLQLEGEVFLSNAIINGEYCLRVCIVNFRTNYSDLEALVAIVLREGKKLHNVLLQNHQTP